MCISVCVVSTAAASDTADDLNNLRYSIQAKEAERATLTRHSPDVKPLQDEIVRLQSNGPAELATMRRDLVTTLAAKEEDAKRKRENEVRRLGDQKARLDAAWEGKKASFDALVAKPSPVTQLEHDRDQLIREQQALAEEQRIVMLQVKTGVCCSECLTSKYEWERGSNNVTFEQHLKIVNGKPIISPQKIAEKENYYAAKIAALAGRMGVAQRRIREAREKHDRELETARTSTEQAERIYLKDVNDNIAAAKAAEERLRDALAALPAERQRLEQQIREKEQQFGKRISDLGKEIDQKVSSFDKRLADIGTSLQELKTREAQLLVQLNYQDPNASAQENHATEVLQKLDRTVENLPPNLAEIRGNAKYESDEKKLAIIDAFVEAMTHRPEETTDKKVEEMTKGILQAFGLDTAKNFEDDINELVRLRMIDKEKVKLGWPPDSRPCLDLPADNVCHRMNTKAP
jgi:hypothetical protein